MEKNSAGKFVFKPQFAKDLKIAAANAIILARIKKTRYYFGLQWGSN